MGQVVIFDCDGVLVNSEDLIVLAMTEVMAEDGQVFPPEKSGEFFGMPFEIQIASLAAYVEKTSGYIAPAQWGERIRERYEALQIDHLRATPGLTELLDTLQRHNIPFGIASNSHRPNIENKLTITNIFNYFSGAIYSKQDVARPKPAPDVYLLAAEKLGAKEKSDIIVIEDSPTGVRAGAAAGAYVIGIMGVYKNGRITADQLSDAGASTVVQTMAEAQERIMQKFGLIEKPLVKKPFRRPGPE